MIYTNYVDVVKEQLDVIEVMYAEGDIIYECSVALAESICNVRNCLEEGEDSRVLDEAYVAFINNLDELKNKKGKVN